MRTVHPSIMIGAYRWDQDRVPRDEFDSRLGALHRVMDAQGWKAIIIFGDAAEHSALAHFSHFTPRLRWGMALLPRKGEPRLIAAMTPRDVPATKLMTWIAEVHSGSTWIKAFDPWLAQFDGNGPIDIGTVGFDQMWPPLFAAMQNSLGDRFQLHPADDAVAAVRSLRPRELSQIREASKVVNAAAAAIVKACADGKDIEACVLEGERTARLMAAQDVRTLTSFDGGRTLAPFRGAFEGKPDPLVAYIAVKQMGYWAESFVSAGAGKGDLRKRAQAGLDAVLRAATPGAGAGELHARAIAALGSHALHPALSGSIGRRIGLSLSEGGELTRDSRHALRPAEVYALHVGVHDPAAGGAFASAMIAMTANGSELLHRSPDSSAS